jgi:hypothetical protein
MLLDQKLVFSDGTDLTADADSDVIDLGAARDLGTGEPMDLLLKFGTIVSDAALQTTLKGADSEAMDSNLIEIVVTPTVTPTTGSYMRIPIGSHAPKRYLRLSYDLTGGTSPHIPTLAALVMRVHVPQLPPRVL